MNSMTPGQSVIETPSEKADVTPQKASDAPQKKGMNTAQILTKLAAGSLKLSAVIQENSKLVSDIIHADAKSAGLGSQIRNVNTMLDKVIDEKGQLQDLIDMLAPAARNPLVVEATTNSATIRSQIDAIKNTIDGVLKTIEDYKAAVKLKLKEISEGKSSRGLKELSQNSPIDAQITRLENEMKELDKKIVNSIKNVTELKSALETQGFNLGPANQPQRSNF